MTNNLQNSALATKILEKLKSGKVKMRPKIYFILKAVLIALGIFVAILFLLYFISFIVFALRASGVWYLHSFGFRGIGASLRLLPWLLIFICAILIIVLEVVLKRFTFAYRQPILYSLLGIIIFSFLGSFIMGKTSLHPTLFSQTQKGRFPIGGPLYREYGMAKFRDVHRGIVSEITNNGFILKTPDSSNLSVIIVSKTRFPLGADIKEGDNVVVFGKRDDGTVKAFGIRKVGDDFDFPLPSRSLPSPPNHMRGPFPLPKGR